MTFELRPYQRRALDMVRAEWSRGSRAIVLAIPTGGGKTATGGTFAANGVARGNRVLWLAHRTELIDQAAGALRKLGLHVGEIQAERGRDELAPVQVATIQTLFARGERPPADIVVWDECFPAGTTVDGRAIEDIRVGELVSCFDHVRGEIVQRRVTRLFRSVPSALVRVHIEAGRSLVCTPGHPFWTERGYIHARELKRSDRVLCRLRGGDGSQEGMQAADAAHDVQRCVQEGAARAVDGADQQAASVGQDDGAQSHAARVCAPQDERDASQDPTRAAVARRQRKASAARAGSAGKRSARSGALGADGARRANGRAEGSLYPADALQDRHRGPGRDAGNRGGWVQPLQPRSKGAGHPQDEVLVFARVARVEVLQPGGDGAYGGLCPDGHVYNLEVEEHHNYFAAGVLVHNCHHATAATFRQVKDAYPSATHLGLTATPQRADGTALGNVFTAICAPVKVSELITGGYLVPCDVIGPERYADALCMEPLDAIVKHARGQSIVFCGTVAEAKRLAGALNLAGITAGHVDGEQNDRLRADMVRRFKSGELRVLTNVYVLTEGFDHPATETVVLARKCGSEATFLQIVGRGLRAAEGKSRALLLDLHGCVHKHGLPDVDRAYSLDGDAIKPADEKMQLRTCPECAAVFRTRSTCPRCGYVFPPPPPPRVEPQAIARVGAVATGKQQLDSWLRLCRTAKLRGYKPGFAAHKFREQWGFWPPRHFPRFEQVTP